MKIQEIEIKPKTIVLGIFNTKTFDFFRKAGALEWYTFCKWDPNWLYRETVQTVQYASEIADSVIFVLDKIQFPIDVSKSVTCEELDMVCKSEFIFNKTVFVRGEEVINFDKNLVI